MATSRPAPSSKIPAAPRIVGESEKERFDQALHRRVSERAYRLYESSGREDGNHHAHWLQAQSEVLQRGLEIRESGSWLSINAALPGVHFLPMTSPMDGAAAVKELLRDPGLVERIGTQAQELVAKSDWRVIAASAVAEMSRAAAQSGARA